VQDARFKGNIEDRGARNARNRVKVQGSRNKERIRAPARYMVQGKRRGTRIEGEIQDQSMRNEEHKKRNEVRGTRNE
jgi:DNA topoisomerase VI subunit B